MQMSMHKIAHLMIQLMKKKHESKYIRLNLDHSIGVRYQLQLRQAE